MKMSPLDWIARTRVRVTIASLGAVLLAASASAQNVNPPATPATVDPQTLARYDRNQNGRLDPDEIAAMNADAATAARTAPEVADETIVLSPFQVEASNDDVGYYASQSLSGTRLNSKIEDLASSITVVTKQQLLDTAAVDINDIFLYEANTEGMHQYTEYVQDRTFYNEVTTLNPQSANRVRGVGAANMARGNFAASSSIPIDTYNIDAVEISRGPNANIFGLGDAAGTVNLITMRANPNRDTNQVMLRGDSYGGWRSSVDFNRALIKDALALRVAAVHEEKGFKRKPSSEVINRVTVATTVRPWRNTTIRSSYESYHNSYNRANTTLPRDAFSEWMANGMPVWNPTFTPTGQTLATGGWRLLNGATYTAVAANAEVTGFPRGLYPNFNTFWARPSAYIDNGVIERYEMARVSTTNAPGFNANARYSETGDIYRRGGNAFGEPPLILFQSLSVNDRSQYDYTSVNFLAPNHGKDKADIYQIELEQWLINSPRQQLALQVGFYREDIARFDHNFLSRTDGATPIVAIDINEFYMDGTPNPYFLRPYIGASEPRVNNSSELNDSSRATLAYQFDFGREDGWMRWLGRHRFAAYAEKRDILTTSIGGRERIISDHAWTSANDRLSLPLRGANYNIYPRYYLGGPVTEAGPVIDYAPSAPRNIPGSMPFLWYGNNSRTPITEMVELDNVIFTGSSRHRQIRTQGLVWQGFLWNDRIVPTMGWRHDKPRERQSRSLNSNPPPNATTTIDPDTRRHDLSFLDIWPNPWISNEGSTKTKGVVVKPLSWMNVHYNESDSFLPEPVRYDIHLNVLPNPTGSGKDYGFSVNLFEGKVIAKVNKYETVQLNSRSGATSGAFAQRTFRFFFDPGADLVYNATNDSFNNSLDPWDLEQAATQWIFRTVPGTTPEAARQQALQTYLAPFGFDQNYMDQVRDIGGGNFAEVNTVTSKGIEFELNYNPSPNWTVKVTAAKQEAIDSELSNNINRFFEEHIDALQSIIVPTDPVRDLNGNIVLDTNGNPTLLPGAGTPWWRTNIGSGSTAAPETWYFVNIQTTLKQASVNAGKPRPQTRKWRFNVTTNYRLAGLTENRWLRNLSVGGAIRWEDKAALGYFGGAPLSNGAIVDLDPNRPIYDKARAYVDLLATYDLRLFDDRVKARLQLNVRNALESGRLQPFVFNPDGQAWNYRIIDPRQFIFSATFDL